MKLGYFVFVLIVALSVCMFWAQEHPDSNLVMAVVETEPVPNDGDAADDPAIWLHPTNAALSTIIGTDKEGGLAVYDLTGKELQYLALGEFNNVDLRSGFPFQSGELTVVAVSDETNNTLTLFRVNAETRLLEPLPLEINDLGLSSPYGLCMYHSSSGFYIFVNGRKGKVEQWQLTDMNSVVRAKLVRTFYVGSQVEGCVADDELETLYIGEERKGIWRYGAEPSAGDMRVLVDDIQGHLHPDVEGLTLFYAAGGKGYLLASSQGADEFAVYTREDNTYVTSFTVGPSETIDRVSETDGIDVTSVNLGEPFSQGLLVVQDHSNGDDNQNFKFVPWSLVADILPPLD